MENFQHGITTIQDLLDSRKLITGAILQHLPRMLTLKTRQRVVRVLVINSESAGHSSATQNAIFVHVSN